MNTTATYLGTYAHEGANGEFMSHSFASDGGVFSLSSNSNPLAGVEPGSVFEISGLTFETVLDDAGIPLTTKRGDPVLKASRESTDTEIVLRFVRSGGFRVVGLPNS